MNWAIRKAKNSSGVIKFEWVNNFIKFIDRDGILHFATEDPNIFKGILTEVNGEICTGDRIDTFGNSFILYGSANDDFVRLSHTLWHLNRFTAFLKQETKIDFNIAFYKQENYRMPVLLVNPDQLEIAKNFVKKYDVEISIYIKND